MSDFMDKGEEVEPPREDRDWAKVATWLVILLALALMVGGGAWMAHQINRLQDAATERQQTLDELTDQYADLYEQAIVEGVRPRTESPDEVRDKAEATAGPQGPRGDRGERGPRGLPGQSIQGPPGRDGQDGQDGRDGESIVGPPGPPGESITGPPGPPGRDGEDGARGADGESITGPPGPAGRDGKDGAPGPAGRDGKDGAPGQQGPPGRGIDTIVCGDDGIWTIHYTDGTQSSTAGPCRAVTTIPPADPIGD